MIPCGPRLDQAPTPPPTQVCDTIAFARDVMDRMRAELTRHGVTPPCADCGAGPGADCADECPSAITLDHDLLLADEDAYEPPCCGSNALCGCRMGGAA